jgi:hypothetical protein
MTRIVGLVVLWLLPSACTTDENDPASDVAPLRDASGGASGAGPTPDAARDPSGGADAAPRMRGMRVLLGAPLISQAPRSSKCPSKVPAIASTRTRLLKPSTSSLSTASTGLPPRSPPNATGTTSASRRSVISAKSTVATTPLLRESTTRSIARTKASSASTGATRPRIAPGRVGGCAGRFQDERRRRRSGRHSPRQSGDTLARTAARLPTLMATSMSRASAWTTRFLLPETPPP